jgi:hypothetical protein
MYLLMQDYPMPRWATNLAGILGAAILLIAIL